MCFICEDKGFILYKKKIGQSEYEFVAHCTCERGKGYVYEGRESKHPSSYRIPSIVEVFPESVLYEKGKIEHKADEAAVSREVGA